MSVVKVRLIAFLGAGVALAPSAFAGSQEQAVRDLARIEDGLRSGTVITAVSNDGAGHGGVIERCTLTASSIRVDSIMAYDPAKALRNPTVIVQISAPDGTMSASVALHGNFANADAAFARLYSKPAPEVRKLEGNQPVAARALQVLGWTGSAWLSQKLRQAGDATVTRNGEEEVLIWGENQPLKTQVLLRANQPFLAGYDYFPGPTNHAFTQFSIHEQPADKGALATFEKVTTGSEADEHYRLSIVKFEHTTPSRDVFTLSEPEHSLINSVADPESVSRIVDGKRVQHYRSPNPNSEGSSLLPIVGLAVGGLAFVGCIGYGGMLMMRSVKRP